MDRFWKFVANLVGVLALLLLIGWLTGILHPQLSSSGELDAVDRGQTSHIA